VSDRLGDGLGAAADDLIGGHAHLTGADGPRLDGAQLLQPACQLRMPGPSGEVQGGVAGGRPNLHLSPARHQPTRNLRVPFAGNAPVTGCGPTVRFIVQRARTGPGFQRTLWPPTEDMAPLDSCPGG